MTNHLKIADAAPWSDELTGHPELHPNPSPPMDGANYLASVSYYSPYRINAVVATIDLLTKLHTDVVKMTTASHPDTAFSDKVTEELAVFRYDLQNSLLRVIRQFGQPQSQGWVRSLAETEVSLYTRIEEILVSYVAEAEIVLANVKHPNAAHDVMQRVAITAKVRQRNVPRLQMLWDQFPDLAESEVLTEAERGDSPI